VDRSGGKIDAGVVRRRFRSSLSLGVVGYMGHSALYNRIIGGATDRLVELGPCKVLVVK
jgi:nucleotide-binding universal stress UspA family protein